MGCTEGFLNVGDHFPRSCRSVVFSIIGRQNHHIIHKGSCLTYIYIYICVLCVYVPVYIYVYIYIFIAVCTHVSLMYLCVLLTWMFGPLLAGS